jgi:hypothetical protein
MLLHGDSVPAASTTVAPESAPVHHFWVAPAANILAMTYRSHRGAMVVDRVSLRCYVSGGGAGDVVRIQKGRGDQGSTIEQQAGH